MRVGRRQNGVLDRYVQYSGLEASPEPLASLEWVALKVVFAKSQGEPGAGEQACMPAHPSPVPPTQPREAPEWSTGPLCPVLWPGSIPRTTGSPRRGGPESGFCEVQRRTWSRGAGLYARSPQPSTSYTPGTMSPWQANTVKLARATTPPARAALRGRGLAGGGRAGRRRG